MLVAITGASGAQIAVKLLKSLKKKGIKVELIISKIAEIIINTETEQNISEIRNLATKNYDFDDLAAPPASGSYKFDAMVIVPCTIGCNSKWYRR